MRAIEFYSGIGGLHLALDRSCVPGRVVTAYDWDQAACQVYAANFGPNVAQKVSISYISIFVAAAKVQLSGLKADLWLLSPACQPYTVLNSAAQGAADPRAQSFLHLINNVLPELATERAHPCYILIENVAGFHDSATRHNVASTLKRLGYMVAEFILNPLQFGIPNSRLRYYLLAKLSPLGFMGLGDTFGRVLDHIPLHGGEPVTPHSLRHYLDDPLNDEMMAPYKIPDCILRYTQLVEGSGSILQTNEQLSTTEVFDKFLAAQAGGDEDAVRLLDRLGLRYFTPNELLRLFYLVDPSDTNAPDDFVWPPSISRKSKYRLIGNSVNVEVVRRLIEYLFTEDDERQDVAQ
ncbi:hypothetical protein ID866_6682 [Astraeus odoratus]|nr:hypothetical protein ID866_6682 [Astraeus odoratus]